jgi:hypothetical protein
MKIHSVFYISLFEPADPNISQSLASEIHPDSQELENEFEKVLNVRKIRKRLQLLVKWLGYRNEHNTWESRRNLTHCEEALREFYEENPEKPEKD